MEYKYFQKDAKEVVDMLFDANVFKEKFTREDLAPVDDLIEFLLQSKFDSYKRGQELLKILERNVNER